jgi:hypothetical protein
VAESPATLQPVPVAQEPPPAREVADNSAHFAVRAELFDCATVDPVAFEETLPDGRVVPMVGGSPWVVGSPVSTSIRLYLRLQSLTDRWLLVSRSQGALTIVPDDSPQPSRSAPESADWVSLPPSGSAVVYLTIIKWGASNGIFSQSLVANSYDPAWRSYVLGTFSLELTPAGCRPLDATDIPADAEETATPGPP